MAKADPELAAAVTQGQMAVSIAAQAADLPPQDQREIAKEAKAGRKNVVRTTIKKKRRAKRERELAQKQRALPEQKFGVIYADPEWRFESWSDVTGMDRAADNHYPTSETADIIMRPVKTIAAKDCVLFLWATAPMLPQALRVMKAWGFEYKSHCVWDKVKVGTGYWFRSQHELLLVGTRGDIPAPSMGEQAKSIIGSQKTTHSTKPEAFLQLIEKYFPTLPKIELNRRGPLRKGWGAWGNEADVSSAGSRVGDED
jgi:N6-adenosine-specific RNA methylase IME4